MGPVGLATSADPNFSSSERSNPLKRLGRVLPEDLDACAFHGAGIFTRFFFSLVVFVITIVILFCFYIFFFFFAGGGGGGVWGSGCRVLGAKCGMSGNLLI